MLRFSILIYLLLSFSNVSFAQDSKDSKRNKTWISTGEIAFIIPNDVDYNYGILENGKLSKGATLKLDPKISYGILYTINYPIFNKFTLGAIGGYQKQTSPKINSLKVGAIMRYYFVDYNNINSYLMTGYNIALNKYVKSGMGNIRVGTMFPIKKMEKLNLTLNLFWDYNFYDIKKPIFYGINEKPGQLTYKSYGFSLGIKF